MNTANKKVSTFVGAALALAGCVSQGVTVADAAGRSTLENFFAAARGTTLGNGILMKNGRAFLYEGCRVRVSKGGLFTSADKTTSFKLVDPTENFRGCCTANASGRTTNAQGYVASGQLSQTWNPTVTNFNTIRTITLSTDDSGCHKGNGGRDSSPGGSTPGGGDKGCGSCGSSPDTGGSQGGQNGGNGAPGPNSYNEYLMKDQKTMLAATSLNVTFG